MEAVVQILEANDLIPVMHIPVEMRNSRLEVTVRPVVEKPPVEKKKDYKAFWAEFDRLAKASSDEELRDEDFQRTNSSREFELLTDED
jgi:hypothetical protein